MYVRLIPRLDILIVWLTAVLSWRLSWNEVEDLKSVESNWRIHWCTVQSTALLQKWAQCWKVAFWNLPALCFDIHRTWSVSGQKLLALESCTRATASIFGIRCKCPHSPLFLRVSIILDLFHFAGIFPNCKNQVRQAFNAFACPCFLFLCVYSTQSCNLPQLMLRTFFRLLSVNHLDTVRKGTGRRTPPWGGIMRAVNSLEYSLRIFQWNSRRLPYHRAFIIAKRDEKRLKSLCKILSRRSRALLLWTQSISASSYTCLLGL